MVYLILLLLLRLGDQLVRPVFIMFLLCILSLSLSLSLYIYIYMSVRVRVYIYIYIYMYTYIYIYIYTCCKLSPPRLGDQLVRPVVEVEVVAVHGLAIHYLR